MNESDLLKIFAFFQLISDLHPWIGMFVNECVLIYFPSPALEGSRIKRQPICDFRQFGPQIQRHRITCSDSRGRNHDRISWILLIRIHGLPPDCSMVQWVINFESKLSAASRRSCTESPKTCREQVVTNYRQAVGLRRPDARHAIVLQWRFARVCAQTGPALPFHSGLYGFVGLEAPGRAFFGFLSWLVGDQDSPRRAQYERFLCIVHSRSE